MKKFHDLHIILIFSLAWFIPGSGHFCIRQKLKGFLFFVLLASLYLAGMIIMDFRKISFYDHPYYFCCRLGCPGFLVAFLPFSSQSFAFSSLMNFFELGSLYTSISCLLNILLLLNLHAQLTKILKKQYSENPAKAPGFWGQLFFPALIISNDKPDNKSENSPECSKENLQAEENP